MPTIHSSGNSDRLSTSNENALDNKAGNPISLEAERIDEAAQPSLQEVSTAQAITSTVKGWFAARFGYGAKPEKPEEEVSTPVPNKRGSVVVNLSAGGKKEVEEEREADESDADEGDLDDDAFEDALDFEDSQTIEFSRESDADDSDLDDDAFEDALDYEGSETIEFSRERAATSSSHQVEESEEHFTDAVSAEPEPMFEEAAKTNTYADWFWGATNYIGSTAAGLASAVGNGIVLVADSKVGEVLSGMAAGATIDDEGAQNAVDLTQSAVDASIAKISDAASYLAEARYIAPVVKYVKDLTSSSALPAETTTITEAEEELREEAEIISEVATPLLVEEEQIEDSEQEEVQEKAPSLTNRFLSVIGFGTAEVEEEEIAEEELVTESEQTLATVPSNKAGKAERAEETTQEILESIDSQRVFEEATDTNNLALSILTRGGGYLGSGLYSATGYAGSALYNGGAYLGGGALGLVGTAASKAVEVATPHVVNVGSKAVSLVKEAPFALADAAVTVFEYTGVPVAKTVGAAFERVTENSYVQSGVTAASNAINSRANAVRQTASDAVSQLADTATSYLDAGTEIAGNAYATATEVPVNYVADLIGRDNISAAVTAIGHAAVAAAPYVQEAPFALAERGFNAFDATVELTSNVYERTGNFIEGTVGVVGSGLSTVGGALSTASGYVGSTASAVAGAAGNTASAIGAVGSTVFGAASSAASAVGTAGSTVLGAAASTATVLGNTASAIGGTVSNIAGAVNARVNALDDAIDAIDSAPEQISNAAGNLLTTASTAVGNRLNAAGNVAYNAAANATHATLTYAGETVEAAITGGVNLAVTNAARVGNGVVWAMGAVPEAARQVAQNPIVETALGYGAEAGRQVVWGAQVAGVIAAGAASLAVETVQNIEPETISNAAASVLGNTFIADAKDFIAGNLMNLANAAVEAGYGPQLAGIAKAVVGSGINFEQQTADRMVELFGLTGDTHLSNLLMALVPKMVHVMDIFITSNGTPQQAETWLSQKDSVPEMLHWILQSGAVNMFVYMRDNPIQEVDDKAAAFGFTPTEKLGYYLYTALNPHMVAAEAAITVAIGRGELTLSDDPKTRARQIEPYFTEFSNELIKLAFGDQQNLSMHHKLILNISKSVIASVLSKNFKLGQSKPADNLSMLTIENARAQLKAALTIPAQGATAAIPPDESLVNLLVNTAGVISHRVAREVDHKIIREMLSDFPEISTYLDTTPTWKTHLEHIVQIVLINGMRKHIEERTAGVDVSLTPADTIERALGVFYRHFDDLTTNKGRQIDDAFRIVDETRRNKKLCKLFKPMARDLYSIMGSEIPLPFPMLTREFFEEKILNEVMPLIAADFYKEWGSHREVIAEARVKLSEVVEHNYVEAGCGVLVEFIRQFVPHLLKNDADDLSKKIHKLIQDQLTDERLDDYIDCNFAEVCELVSDHLQRIGRPSGEEDAKLFIEQNAGEVRKLVLSHLKATNATHILDQLTPTATDVANYLACNNTAIKSNIAKNLEALGQGQGVSNVMNVALPLVHGAVLDGIATAYTKLQNMRDAEGNPNFMTLVLKMLKTGVEHMQKVNAVRLAHNARGATHVSDEEMFRGFGKDIHPGVAVSEEAISARKLLKEERVREKMHIRDLRKAKAEHAKAVRKGNKKNISKTAAKLALCRERLAASQKVIKGAEAVIDPVREEHMKKVIEQSLLFAGIEGPDDLKTVPAALRKQLYPIIKNGLLPKIGTEIFKLALTPRIQNKILLGVLQLVRETENQGGVDKIVYIPPKDETQKQLDEALGMIVKQFISTLPSSATYAVLQLEGINKLTASTLGGLIRQKLGAEGALLGLIEQGIKGAMPSLTPGTWSVDAEGNRVFNPEGGEYSFDLPGTAEEKEEYTLKNEQKETDSEKQVRRELAKTITGQMKRLVVQKRDRFFELILKNMIRFLGGSVDDAPPAAGEEKIHRTHRGLWEDLQAILDAQIEAHLGRFGLHVKHAADKICRFFIITLMGTVLKLICSPMYKAAFWVIEKYIEHRAHLVKDVMQMGILEDLYLRLTDDFLEMANNPAEANPTELINELLASAEVWEKQREVLSEMEKDQSKLGRLAALKREIHRIWSETPNRTRAMGLIAKEIRALTKPNYGGLIGNKAPIGSLYSSDKDVKAGYKALDNYDVITLRPDGHCLFRGVGLELLKATQRQGVQGKAALLEKVAPFIPTENEKTAFEDVLNKLYDVPTQSPEKIMNFQGDSDLVVKVLRDISCEYNRAHGGEVLAAVIAGEVREEDTPLTTDEYLARIARMTPESSKEKLPPMGGEPELVALSQALGVKMTVLDVTTIGRNENGVINYGEGDAAVPEITLLYLKGDKHYHVAVKKLEGAGNVEAVGAPQTA